VSAAAQSWFGLEDEQPAWVPDVAAVLASVAAVLPALVVARVAGYERPDAIATPAAAAVRARLATLGFVLEAPPMPAPSVVTDRGALEHAPPPTEPWGTSRRSAGVRPVAAEIEAPYRLHVFDAYHPMHGIGVDIEWSDEPSPHFADHELALVDTDVRHLALARRRFERSVGVFERLLADDRTRRSIARRLPLRGVLIVEIA